MGQIYRFLGMKTGLIQNGMPPAGEEARLRGRRHLRHELRVRLRLPARQHGHARAARVQRGHHFAIVDEVDSILIDEARTPLIISGAGTQAADTYKKFARVMPGLKEDATSTWTRPSAPSTPRRAAWRRSSHARHREHLRRPVRPAGEPPAAGAQGAVPLPPRRGLRRDGRRGEDRRRVHRPHHGGPPLLARACTRRSRPRNTCSCARRTRRSPPSRCRTTSASTTSSPA